MLLDFFCTSYSSCHKCAEDTRVLFLFNDGMCVAVVFVCLLFFV